jgi:hypothetical protein
MLMILPTTQKLLSRSVSLETSWCPWLFNASKPSKINPTASTARLVTAERDFMSRGIVITENLPKRRISLADDNPMSAELKQIVLMGRVGGYEFAKGWSADGDVHGGIPVLVTGMHGGDS